MTSQKKFALICVDASEHSRRAVEWFFDRLYCEGDDVGLVHVHVAPNLPGFGGEILGTDVYMQMLNESVASSKRVVETYKDICEQQKVTPKVFLQSMNESVGHTICTTAKENNVSLIISGQRGLGAFRRAIFGSVSDYILHHSHLPVIIVPPSSFDLKKE